MSELMQVALAVVGVLIPVGAFLWEFVLGGRKRLGYRVQMDTIPADVSAVHAGAWGRLEKENGDHVRDPSFVLMRIENIGTSTIAEADYVARGDSKVGIRVRFPGRKVVGVVPTELSHRSLNSWFVRQPQEGRPRGSGELVRATGPTDPATDGHALRPVVVDGAPPAAVLASRPSAVPGFGIEADPNDGGTGVVTLPRVTLNRGVHYKVLIALERAPGNNDAPPFADPVVDAMVSGGVRDGRIKETRGRTGRPRWATVSVALLAFLVLAEPFALDLVDQDVPLDCAGGNLAVTGSTAFEPVLREAAASYTRTCPNANFSFQLSGSVEGLRTLDAAGHALDANGSVDGGPPMIAFSDGAKEGDQPMLLPRPIALPLFTLVVNSEAGVQDLRLDQIRQIYSGTVLNWSEVGGRDLPVRLVGRSAGSGTRKTFERQVLGGRWEPEHNSDDCQEVSVGAQPGVVQCERSTTNDLLQAVAATPGAMGYSEVGLATDNEDVLRIRIDGQDATLEAADFGAYPFWETEYAYTYGESKADSLAASFLRYLTAEVGRDIVRSHGHRPCAELANPMLCRPT